MTHRRVLWLALAGATLALAALPRPAEGYENRSTPFVAPDGSGGIYVLVYRNASGLWLQHFLSDGTPAIGYPPDGLPVDTIPSPSYQVMDSDGSGGAVIAYRSSKIGGNGTHAFRAAPQIAPAPGWPPGGVTAHIGKIGPGTLGIASDGTGGLFSAWQDFRISFDDQDIYAQRLDGAGARPAGWPDSAVAVCRVVGDQFDPVLLSDGAGGCFAAWWDGRNLGPADDNFDIYAQRVGPDGTLLWPASGVAVTGTPGLDYFPTLAGDGAGGVFVAWTGAAISIPEIANPVMLRVQRLTAAGAIAAGWPTDGLDVSLMSNGSTGGLPLIVGDGTGGAYVVWGISAGGASTPGSSIHIQRLAGDGTAASGWPAAGTEIPATGVNRSLTGLFADGEGGAIVAWQHSVDDTTYSSTAQRFGPSGSVAPGWPQAGIALGLTVHTPQLVTDGAGGVTMVRRVPLTGATRVTHVTRGGVVDPGWPGYPTLARLFPPYPQPASGAVTIPLALPALSPLEAKVYDITGRLVRALARTTEFPAGRHTLVWDGRDDDGRRAPNGVYLVRVAFSGSVASTRIVLAR